MTDLPHEIQVWRSTGTLDHIGTWATTRYPAEAVTYVPKSDAELAVADIVRSAWGRCEALEDEAADKLAQLEKLTDHEKGFWRGQKAVAKSIRRATEMPAAEAIAIRALAPADALAEVQRLLGAVEALVVVLDRNDKKGPIPDVEMLFCWLAAQGVRAAFRKIAQKGEAT